MKSNVFIIIDAASSLKYLTVEHWVVLFHIYVAFGIFYF